MKRFWGTKLESFADLVWDRLRKGDVFEASIPGWGKRACRLQYRDLSNIELCSATYKGDGKYDAFVDYAVRWEETAERSGVGDTFVAGSDRGYWPICWVTWRSERSDVGFAGTEEQYRMAQLRGTCAVWVICWYQLFDSTWVMCLWPVFLRSRL
jgi:hypothetical protein